MRKKRLKIEIPIRSDPGRLYDAITNPLKLAIWFCNGGEINLKVRGALRFWGDNCVATAFPEKEIKGTILELEPNRLIRYSWPISGVESQVTFQIDDLGRSCNFTVSHNKIPEGSLMTDAWLIYLYNLQSFMNYNRPGYRFDYSHIDRGTIKRELFIEAVPSVIFKALTDQQKLRVWFAKNAEVEPKVGGKYLSGWQDGKGNPLGPGTIIEYVENKKLVYDWDYPGEKQSGNLATWELTRIGEKTRLALKHSGFGEGRDNRDYAQGWHAYCLALKDLCESGGHLSFQILDGDWSA